MLWNIYFVLVWQNITYFVMNTQIFFTLTQSSSSPLWNNCLQLINYILFCVFCARIGSEFDQRWKWESGENREKNSIDSLDSFRLPFSVSFSREGSVWGEKHKQPKLQNAAANKTKDGFCFVKLAFTKAVWMETWRGRRSILLWHVYEMWKTKPESVWDWEVKNQDNSLWFYWAAQAHMLPPYI